MESMMVRRVKDWNCMFRRHIWAVEQREGEINLVKKSIKVQLTRWSIQIENAKNGEFSIL